jgi:acetate---CoA ligase (ADP-forming)
MTQPAVRPGTAPERAWSRALQPRSVALVGASEDNYYAVSLLENLDKHRYAGEIYLVNPNRPVAFGRPTVPSLADCGHVDLVYSAVNRRQNVDVTRQSAAAGAGGIVVIAEGFRESGEQSWISAEEDISRLARTARMVVFGPNTLGFVVPRTGGAFYSAPVRYPLRDGRVALAMQSGGALSAACGYLSALGIGVRYGIGAGNASATSVSEWLGYFASDPDVGVIGLLAETIDDWPVFRDAALSAAAAGKPVLVCKAGRGSAGQAVTYSHTGAVSDDFAIYRDALDQVGARMVESVNDLVLAVALASRFGKAKASGVGIIGQSGGGNAQIADLCEEAGLTLPPPSADTASKITEATGFRRVGNPIDIASLAMTDRDAFETAFRLYLAEPAFGAVVYNVSLDNDPLRQDFHRRVAAAATAAGKPVIGVPAIHIPAEADTLLDLASATSIMVAPVVEHVVKGMAAWLSVTPGAAAGHGTSTAAGGRDQWRREDEIKQRLRERGLSVPASAWLPADGGQPTPPLPRGPFVAKGLSRTIHHKSRLGLVESGLTTHQEALAAADRIRAAAAAAGVALEGILIEQQITGGLDLLIGLSARQLGDVLVIGSGGSSAESSADWAFSVLPVDDERLRQGLRRAGVSTPSALAGCIRLVRCLADLYREAGLSELECNPVRIAPTGEAWILDVLAFQPASASDQVRRDDSKLELRITDYGY